MERKAVYIVVSTAPGEGVDFFGVYRTYLALTDMIRNVFGEGAHQDSVDLSHFPSSMVEGVERGYRIRPADPAKESTRAYIVLESYPA